MTLWNLILAAASAVWNGIMTVVQVVLSVISAIFSAVVAAITAGWNMVQSIASAVWNAISAVVSAVAGVIRSAITAAVNTVISIFNRVKSIGESVWNGIKGFIDGVGAAIQAVIGFVQSLIDKLSSVGGMLDAINPFGSTGLGFTAYMAPMPGLGPGVLHLAGGYPSVAGLGRLGAGGGTIVQHIDARTIVQVDGSGIADPQQVAEAFLR